MSPTDSMESGHNSVSGDDFKIMGGEIWGRACGKKMGEELLMGLLYLLQTSEEGDGVV